MNWQRCLKKNPTGSNLRFTEQLFCAKNYINCFIILYTMKKAKHQRTDAFELWCWGRLF